MEPKIDRRKHYILVVDTETARSVMKSNGHLDTTQTLVYDLGYQVIDKYGNVYEQASFVNKDIFVDQFELMQSAYYANKIPKYMEDLRNGTRQMSDTYHIRQAVHETIRRWEIAEVCAHNAYFDYSALNNTQRHSTNGKYQWFFPYGITVWDSMTMAKDVICKMPTYQRFCEKHGLLNKYGKPSKSAENLYRFISHNPDFQESHTGLEDVAIEAQIIAYCYRQKKKMRKELFRNRVS